MGCAVQVFSQMAQRHAVCGRFTKLFVRYDKFQEIFLVSVDEFNKI
jgi:hypothetical protein